MAESSLHNCSTCKPNEQGQTDCAVCKLAFLADAKKSPLPAPPKGSALDDDDYSISERLTEKKSDNSILVLFIVGVATLLAVIGFTLILTRI